MLVHDKECNRSKLGLAMGVAEMIDKYGSVLNSWQWQGTVF